jgi:hypothetical protein
VSLTLAVAGGLLLLLAPRGAEREVANQR